MDPIAIIAGNPNPLEEYRAGAEAIAAEILDRSGPLAGGGSSRFDTTVDAGGLQTEWRLRAYDPY